MKKVLFVSLLIVGAVGTARADDDRPGRDWISISRVTTELQQMGFTQISKIEADDGLWEAKGFQNGAFYKVKLDPHDGHVVSRQLHNEDHDDD